MRTETLENRAHISAKIWQFGPDIQQHKYTRVLISCEAQV